MSRTRRPARGHRTPGRGAAEPAPLPGDSPCPCGRAETYEACCGAFHAGRALPATPERLMRSRYSAFAVRDAGYLLRTWHPTTRPAALDLDPALTWTGLEILGTTGGTAFHQEGTVAFRARYGSGGGRGEQTEDSRFVREDGAWYYLDAADGG